MTSTEIRVKRRAVRRCARTSGQEYKIVSCVASTSSVRTGYHIYTRMVTYLRHTSELNHETSTMAPTKAVTSERVLSQLNLCTTATSVSLPRHTYPVQSMYFFPLKSDHG